MCGIVAYLGKKAAQPILIEGLKRLNIGVMVQLAWCCWAAAQ